MQNATTNVKRWNIIPKRKPGRLSKYNDLESITEFKSVGQSQKETAEAFSLLCDDPTSQAAAYLVTGTFESKLIKGSDLRDALKSNGYVRDEVKGFRTRSQHDSQTFF